MSYASPNLSKLPRNTLSIILSYLQHEPITSNGITGSSPPHNRDAVSLLITNKRFAFAILPLFRLPKHLSKIHEHEVKNDDGSYRTVVMVEKYRFITLPIQDPRTLLDRLNTRRLRRRIVYLQQTQQKLHRYRSYHYGRTIEELAMEEWLLLQIHHKELKVVVQDTIHHVWPAHLELLRFGDCTIFDDDFGKDNKKKLKFKKLFHLCGGKPQDMSATPDKSFSPHCNAFGNNVGLLCSYPRSGNTLMRTLLERITSTVTGSDTRPDRSLSMKLALEHDLVGEGLTGKDPGQNTIKKSNISLSQNRKLHQTCYDPTVNIIKTHFPERKGWRGVNANRVVLLVRNPYDAIDSYWNLCCTNTHTSSLDESVYKKYAAKFESMARHEIKVWCDFNYYWLDVCARESIPLLIVRYEDLILSTEKEMQRVIGFLIGETNSESDTFWKWRVSHALGLATEFKNKASTKSPCTASLGSYRPRSSNGGLSSIGKSLRKNRYSQSVLCHINDVAASLELERKTNTNSRTEQTHITLLQRFGYDIVDQKFPSNFAHHLSPQADTINSPLSTGKKNENRFIEVNTTPEIRSSDDPFGRAMTNWRRAETNGDTCPFPTIPR